MLELTGKLASRTEPPKKANSMSSVISEELTRPICDFLQFARSRPSDDDLARAVSKVLSVPRHPAVNAELQNVLLEVRDLYPGLRVLELHLALLPARIDDNYRASELLEQFVDKFASSPWGYIQGIKISTAANLYRRADQIAWRALEHLDKLVPFGPTECYALLAQAGQIGRHPLFFELCNRFAGLLNEMPAYRTCRFGRVADNLRNEAYEQITFISFGTNCLPWTVGNRWGFRPLLTENKHQLPLNYGLQTGQSCHLMLQDRFTKLSDSSEYVLTRSQYGFDIAMHRGYRFMFNHEVGKHWLDQGCRNLVSRYKQRVRNFFKYAIEGPRVYILYLPWDIDTRTIERSIAELSTDENYRLLIIDSRTVADDMDTRHPNTIWRKINLPSSHYIWWQDFDSEEGVRFETAIHDAIRDAARELTT